MFSWLFLQSLLLGLATLGEADQSSSSPTPATYAGLACVNLNNDLLNSVLYPNSSQYAQSLSSYFSQQEEELEPTCIVQPSNAEELSKAIKCLVNGASPNASTPFAVRSGGASYFAGAANIAGGITIDLSRLNRVSLSPDRQRAVIGTGATWGAVYETLDPMNLTVVGGRVSLPGVGGTALGGGLSFLSPRHGFVCDNILNYEIVIANGSILNANATSNSDLWLALRGGSNNFGIVTAFETPAFEQGPFWGGHIIYNVSTAAKNIEALYNFNSLNYDESSYIIPSVAYTNVGGKSITAVSSYLQYLDPQVNPPTFHNFTSIPALTNTMRIDSMKNFTDELAVPSPTGFRQFGLTLTYENDLSTLQRTYELFNAKIPAIQSIPNITWVLTYEPLPTAITAKSASSGGNVLGLSQNTSPLMIVLLEAIWTDPSNDTFLMNTLQDLFEDIGAAAVSAGVANSFEYLNYADISQDPISSYGPENVAFLRNVSLEYDPKRVFQVAQPGGFKLFR